MPRGVFFLHRDQNPMRIGPSGAIEAKEGVGRGGIYERVSRD